MKPVYFDNNATTRVDPRVVEAMLPFFTEQFGNPSSMHASAAMSAAAVKQARGELQSLLGAEHDHEIVFTSGGTESDNTAILSALEANPRRREIVTSAVEHPGGAVAVRVAGEEQGYPRPRHSGRFQRPARPGCLRRGVVGSGRHRLDHVGEQRNRHHLPGCRAGREGQSGRRAVPHRRGAGGRQDSNRPQVDRDRHALAVRPQAARSQGHRRTLRAARRALSPADQGRASGTRPPGRHREHAGHRRARQGGGARGCTTWQKRIRACAGCAIGWRRGWSKGSATALSPAIPTTACPTPPMSRSSISRAKGILLLLNKEGIAASSGSACTSGSLEPSHVLRAMKIPYTAAHGAIRFSLSRESTDDEVDHVLTVMPAIVDKLRDISPFWSKEGSAAGVRTSLCMNHLSNSSDRFGDIAGRQRSLGRSCSTTRPCATANRPPGLRSAPPRRWRSRARWRAPASRRSRPALPRWGGRRSPPSAPSSRRSCR